MRGERVLFRDISLAIAPGEALVVRGPNGAGKTTLLRILAGLTRAETGKVLRAAPLHWLGHRDGLKPHETPRAHLALWASAWGAGRPDDSLIGRMGLLRAADVPARFLSAGQRRRTAIARLLLEPRQIWLLDEPFTALDADGARLVGELIAAHQAGGGAVIAAIHGDAPIAAARELLL